MLTIEAVIDRAGECKTSPAFFPCKARRALLVILDEPAPILAETALLSEAALAEDWLKPEEDKAWAYLQR